MATDNKILLNLFKRFNVQDEIVLRNAEIYLRSLQAKNGLKGINDTAKAIICIDLAATKSNTNFDKETAVKLSGLRKTVYQNNVHTIEKVLDLNKPISVSELCVSLSCTEAKERANQIFTAYRKEDNLNRDFNHPQYATAAVYTACRGMQIKVEKPKFLAASHLKPAQWKELEVEFEKFAKASGLILDKANKQKKNDFTKFVDKQNSGEDDKNLYEKKVSNPDNQTEDYETWKKRILAEAYKALSTSQS